MTVGVGSDYTRQQVADLLRTSECTVDRLVQQGKLDAYRVTPRRVRITAASVDAYLARCREAERLPTGRRW